MKELKTNVTYIYNGILLKNMMTRGLIKLKCIAVNEKTYEISIDDKPPRLIFKTKFHDDNDEYFVEIIEESKLKKLSQIQLDKVIELFTQLSAGQITNDEYIHTIKTQV